MAVLSAYDQVLVEEFEAFVRYCFFWYRAAKVAVFLRTRAVLVRVVLIA